MSGDIKKTWIIVRKPGCIPVVKKPDLYDHATDMIREMMTYDPDGTTYDICRLTWNDDLWVEDGAQEMKILEQLAAVD